MGSLYSFICKRAEVTYMNTFLQVVRVVQLDEGAPGPGWGGGGL